MIKDTTDKNVFPLKGDEKIEKNFLNEFLNNVNIYVVNRFKEKIKTEAIYYNFQESRNF